MKRLGVGYDEVHERNPRLVYLSCPGYPEGHRMADRPGYDALIQASSGQQWEQPGWRMGPIFLHMPMPSMGACFLIPTGILAALVAREETGRGQHVTTSLYQGALLYTTQVWQHVEKAPPSYHELMGKTYPPGIHQQMLFEVANGEWVHSSVMSGLTPKASQDELLGLEDPPDPLTFLTMAPEEREGFTAARREAYKHHQRDELVKTFQDNNHAIEAVITMEEALGAGGRPHPQLVANGMVAEIDDPELGATTQIGVPINLLGTPGGIQGPQPLPGEHNTEIFGLLGYSDVEIAAFSEVAD
jgi:crotonobetainyl-CoA:carnitine CoA-transferase CaiB-like acyl-CoA transferase